MEEGGHLRDGKVRARIAEGSYDVHSLAAFFAVGVPVLDCTAVGLDVVLREVRGDVQGGMAGRAVVALCAFLGQGFCTRGCEELQTSL